MKKKTWISLGAVAAAALVVVGTLTARANDTSADNVADNTITAANVTKSDPAAIARGHRLAIAGDCAACHTATGGPEFAGGHDLQTPFGGIYSTNITPDTETGIGNWTERDFFNAVRHGQSPNGMLYPAMPYTAYVQINDQDMHDLWAYFTSLKPEKAYGGQENSLPFPFNIRLALAGWNLLFFDNRPFATDASQSKEWNKGHYLVDSLGHCGTCHTGKNFFGGDQSGEYLAGGTLSNWHAPDLTSSKSTGLAAWSAQDIATYLRTGSNSHAVATGPMAEAIEASTQHMQDTEISAIATYLKSLPAHTQAMNTPLDPKDPVMVRGQRIYETSCSACHAPSGQGIAGMATRLADNSAVRSEDPASLIHVLMTGARAARTKDNPTGAGMPSYAWKLSDKDAAAVLTYVRNAWGNAADPVDPGDVADARDDLGARKAL